MQKHLVSINDLPPDGKEFSLDDQNIWNGPLEEFKMDCRINTPLHAVMFVQRADEGLVIRGDIKGAIVVPCNRCAEDATVLIDSEFNEYEEIPEEDANAKVGDHDGYIVYDRHAPMLDLAAVAWEQFMLAQPSMPLCRDDCKGLCPKCGCNLNHGECGCKKDTVDPRMAPLAGLKIRKDKVQ